jgi:CO/xanthine dehydrogenase Mo-binding subunit
VKHLDLSKALAMPGVRAILTQDDLPAPADSVTDLGAVIKANKQGEKALTMEPLYHGEPILAVAAVDELTAAEAIEAIDIEFEHLPFVVDPLDSLRPGGPNPRTDGNIWIRPQVPPAKPGEKPRALHHPRSENSNGQPQISPKRRMAACPWARRLTSGPTAMWMPD